MNNSIFPDATFELFLFNVIISKYIILSNSSNSASVLNVYMQVVFISRDLSNAFLVF